MRQRLLIRSYTFKVRIKWDFGKFAHILYNNYLYWTFRIGEEKAEIIHISEPIKSHWAQEKGLNLTELLSDGPYKEKYRKEMLNWSESVRQHEPGFFCKASIQKSMSTKKPNFYFLEQTVSSEFCIFFISIDRL